MPQTWKKKSRKFYYGPLSVLQTLLHITDLPFLTTCLHQIPVPVLFLQRERFHKYIGANASQHHYLGGNLPVAPFCDEKLIPIIIYKISRIFLNICNTNALVQYVNNTNEFTVNDVVATSTTRKRGRSKEER
jgi:hypothetical protein